MFKFNFSFLSLICIILPLLTFAVSPVLTREALLSGSEFPEKRVFPVATDVKPCDDFYKYACSKVESDFKLRDDRSSHTFSFDDAKERLLHAKKKFLKNLSSLAKPTKRASMIRDVYQACMDETASVLEEKELVRQEIAALTGARTREAFQQLMSDRIDKTEATVIEWAANVPNQDDPNWRDLILGVDLRTFPDRSYYANAEAMADLELLAADFFKTIQLDHPEDRAKGVVAFEKEMAAAFPTPTEQRDRMNSRSSITRAELLKKFPALNLNRFLKRVPQKILIRNMYPESLAFANKELTVGDLERLRNVMLFQSVKKYMDDAYPEFFKKRFQFQSKHLGGPTSRSQRDERCTQMVMNQFGRELDSEIMPTLFPSFPKKQVIELAEKIRLALVENLKANQWLTPVAKATAVEKMKAATLLLVSPDTEAEWRFNPTATYSQKKSYANIKLLNTNLIARKIKELSEKRNRRHWLMGPLDINAYYIAMDNVFVLPIGILQYPFFDSALPMETNLAAIGSIIGHELGHGIDDKGSRYDKDGKLRTWMTDTDLKNFQARGALFTERFDRLGHNGKLTLGENIGDHVGIISAYRAAFLRKEPTQENRQAFFVQYARSWCGVIRPAFRERLLKTDPHAMGEARVNEQVRHLGGFHDAFSCKQGDEMFLAEKDRIRVW